MTYAPGTNSGHGHVWPRPDGLIARCGGPALCPACSIDRAEMDKTIKGKQVGALERMDPLALEAQMLEARALAARIVEQHAEVPSGLLLITAVVITTQGIIGMSENFAEAMIGVRSCQESLEQVVRAHFSGARVPKKRRR